MFRTLFACIFLAGYAHGQGYVYFATRDSGGIDAPVIRGPGLPLSGRGAGAGFSAQLYLVKPGRTLEPLEPITIFRTSAVAAYPYVVPVVVQVAGVPGGESARFRVRAFETRAGSYEAALALGMAAGESSDTPPIVLGPSETLTPLLHGLRGFTVNIPEPETITLTFCGVVLLCLLRRRCISINCGPTEHEGTSLPSL